MSSRIAVLYEDKLATSKPKNFGPHVLVLTCVGDRLERSREALAPHVDCHPRKGIGNLLAMCRETILADRYARIIAVCDDDKVREHLKLPALACKVQVRSTIAAFAAPTQKLRAVLLARNVDTVVDAVHRILGRNPPTSKLGPLDRDRTLLHLAYQGTPDQRLDLLERVPSFHYLVDALARTLLDLNL